MSSLFPEFIRKRVEQEIEDAIHPKGMSTHSGRTRIQAADAQRMLAVIEQLEMDQSKHELELLDECRRVTLEEAAALCEEMDAVSLGSDYFSGMDYSARIRALRNRKNE